MIRTKRLRLVPATVELTMADLAGRAELARVLEVTVPEGWPPEFHDAAAIEYTIEQLRRDPEQDAWSMYYFIRDEPGQLPVVLGVGGYKGAPDAEGTVEVGYSIVPEYRRQGFATEATQGMVAHAFRDDRVRRVIGETLPDLVGSIGVLEKSGFTFAGAGSEPGVIQYVLVREAYEPQHPGEPV